MSHPFDIACEIHPEREGKLRIDLPSIGVKRFLCEECNEQIVGAFKAINAERPHPWGPHEYQAERSTDGRSIYADMQGKYKRTDSERTDV